VIQYLDKALRRLFRQRISAVLTSDLQVRFDAPNEAFRTTYMSSLNGDLALSIYLAELRENRFLRSNERIASESDGLVSHTPSPPRLDCHYLISAWDTTAPSAQVEPTPGEHELLYRAVGVLMDSAPLNITAIYGAGSPLLTGIPDAIVDADLPTEVAPVEGFPKLAEFWSSMGAGSFWRPAVYLKVTLPVDMPAYVAGPAVTTILVDVHGGDEVFVVGGTVRDDDAQSPQPVPDAWVRVDELDEVVSTDGEGRFVLSRVARGAYSLSVRAEGFQPGGGPLTVPEPSGVYDVTLTPL
jgi:Pvc16 N-terminal domain/Carboxypeptidase regulatory-like domain